MAAARVTLCSVLGVAVTRKAADVLLVCLLAGVPPRGYRYGGIDGDVVKLAVGTLLIVDAVSGLTD